MNCLVVMVTAVHVKYVSNIARRPPRNCALLNGSNVSIGNGSILICHLSGIFCSQIGIIFSIWVYYISRSIVRFSPALFIDYLEQKYNTIIRSHISYSISCLRSLSITRLSSDRIFVFLRMFLTVFIVSLEQLGHYGSSKWTS